MIPKEARARFREVAVDNRIPCRKCFEIAEEFSIDKKEIASTLTEMGIKIHDCQIGCFD